MTKEEKALIYFKDLRERKVKDYSSVFDTAPKGTVVYEAVSAEIEIYDTAIKALEQEPKTGQWLPCSERLPEEYGEYLITWTTSQSKRPLIGISEGEVTSEYDYEHNRFKLEWRLEDYVKNYPDVKVIAWMPLPKPYGQKESEVEE